MSTDARPSEIYTLTGSPRSEVASWIIAGIALFLVLKLHCLSALLAGLLVYELVRLLAPLVERRLTGKGARLAALALLSILTIALLVALIFATLAFFRSDAGNIHRVIDQADRILQEARMDLPSWVVENLPGDIEAFKSVAGQWIDEHFKEIQLFGKELANFFIRSLFGMVIGALLSLHENSHGTSQLGPFAAALTSRASRFARSFRQVVFAQIKISAINTIFTAIFILGILPLFRIHLPLAKTLVAVTFAAGLLPVLGNLISNTLIFIAGLSISTNVAISALVFLVVIHKLEYFLNARIVGTRIRAQAWELLIAMLAMEVAFGIAGLIAAPIYYAFIKQELTDAGLI
jgi:predicted PurR-regulated permease PerM